MILPSKNGGGSVEYSPQTVQSQNISVGSISWSIDENNVYALEFLVTYRGVAGYWRAGAYLIANGQAFPMWANYDVMTVTVSNGTLNINVGGDYNRTYYISLIQLNA